MDQLAAGSDLFLANLENLGYGRAVNRLVARLGQLPPYIGVLNTDLSWQPGTFRSLLADAAAPECEPGVPDSG